MENEGRELYREFTPWAWWVALIVWIAVGGSAIAAWIAGSTVATVISLASLVILHVGVGGLLVTVETKGVRVGLGRVRLLKAFLPFPEIGMLESVSYKPMREFGGWGLRGTSDKRAWTARGSRAVVVHMKDGRRIYIGSDEPNKLEGRIRNAMNVGS